jgi:hypothetical protein
VNIGLKGMGKPSYISRTKRVIFIHLSAETGKTTKTSVIVVSVLAKIRKGPSPELKEKATPFDESCSVLAYRILVVIFAIRVFSLVCVLSSTI